MLEEQNSVQNRISEKLREKNTSDFRSIPEKKRTDIDRTAIKLSESFEYVTVPATKQERSIKSLWLQKAHATSCFIEIVKGFDAGNKKNVIHFKCGDDTLLIIHNDVVKEYKARRAKDRSAAEMDFMAENSYEEMIKIRSSMEVEYIPRVGLYTVASDNGTTKEVNSFEELEEYLIDYVVDYTDKFKVKQKRPYIH